MVQRFKGWERPPRRTKSGSTRASRVEIGALADFSGEQRLDEGVQPNMRGRVFSLANPLISEKSVGGQHGHEVPAEHHHEHVVAGKNEADDPRKAPAPPGSLPEQLARFRG